METLSLFLFYLPLCLALYILTKHCLIHKIRNLPPTPFPSLPIIGHLYLLKKPLHRTFFKLSNRHGPLFYLQLGSRSLIVASSPSIAEECLSKNDIVFANRPSLLVGKYMGYNNTVVALAPYGDHWRNLRRILSMEVLSTSRLLTMSNIRSDEVKSFVRRLFCGGNRIVDMRTAFFELMLNTITMMIAGRRYYGENVTDEEEAKWFMEVQNENLRLSSMTNIGDYLPWVRPKREFVARLAECARKRDEFAQNLLDEQRKKMESDSSRRGRTTMVQHLLSMREKESEYYTDEIIKGILLTMLTAGTETSINAMEWTMSLLVNHPQVLIKAQKEIDKCIGSDRLIEESDLAQLPYLGAIMSEAMRMYPILPLLIPHLSSEECAVGGYRIPRGSMLFVNTWAIQNDPNIWPDPTSFKPERFEEVGGTSEGFRWMPFGCGRRSCPGEGLALRMVGLALGSLIQCFEWDKVGDQMIDMTEGPGVAMPKLQRLKLTCRPRPNMEKLLSQI